MSRVLANLVDRADVGMVQCRGGLRFSLETSESLGVIGHFVGQKLESDEAMEQSVLGLVDHTHPAAAELLDDAVVRDGLANHAQGCYGERVAKSMRPWIAGVAESQERCTPASRANPLQNTFASGPKDCRLRPLSKLR